MRKNDKGEASGIVGGREGHPLWALGGLFALKATGRELKETSSSPLPPDLEQLLTSAAQHQVEILGPPP